ncbi:MAG TPA: hypothetical protein PKE45_01890 [Caldilineaceae bacterium]|nr:hypothetical protein [Caldilineaceae bacterium]
MTTTKSQQKKKTGLGAEAWFPPPILAEEAKAEAEAVAPQAIQEHLKDEKPEDAQKSDGKIRRTMALTPQTYLTLERMKLHLLETEGKKATLGELVEEAVVDLARKMGVGISSKE